MEIQNGVLQGLELESGFTTSADIQQMDNQLQFVTSYKWKMGDVNAMYVMKQLLSDKKDAKGNRIPYKGSVSAVARKICLAEGMKEEEITKEYLFDRFNKDTDLKSVTCYTRSYATLVNGKKMSKRVLSESYKDAEGKFHPDIHDQIAKVTNAMHKHLRKIREDKLRASDLPEKTIKTTLEDFDKDNKMVKAVKTRIALEVCVIPLHSENFTMLNGFQGFQGIIYTLASDNYDKIKARLHKPGEDTDLDFIELKVSHPIVTKFANDDLNKMQSGLKTDYGVFADVKLKPSNIVPKFQELYEKYAEENAQSALDLKAKVMDFKPMGETEALSLCKDYVTQNYDILTDDEKEKNKEVIARFQKVLTKEEIAKISGVAFTDAPNTSTGDNPPIDQKTDSANANHDASTSAFDEEEGIDLDDEA